MSILTVGALQQFNTIASAIAASHDGDVIQVAAGTYVNDFATINTKITIEGVGGMVHLLATEAPSNGKAILTANTDLTIDHLEFSGAQVSDNNGAGIRYQGGNLTVTNSYFHDNQDGILAATPGTAGTGNISISTSEFAHNGAGDGYSHNIYVNDVANLTIDDSYFHDAVVGHEIKSRAEQTTITNTRIQDGPAGTASYSIDLPNGGAALIKNDVIQQGPQSQNPAIIAYGEEGNLRASSSLSVSGDTILNDLASSSAAAVWNASGASATMSNDKVYGLTAAQLGRGTVATSGMTMLSSEPSLNTSSPWAATLAPAAGSAPAPAQPSGSIVLHMSEDAYQGDAQFSATVDGKAVGGVQTVTALHGQGQSQAITLPGNFGAGAHTVGITFLNDAWGGTAATDRNLYVDSIDSNGVNNPSDQAALYQNGTVSLTTTDASTVPTSTLVLHLSEDAYQGDAQFVATMDGKPLGATQSVTALHSLGQTSNVTFTGQFAAGPHDLAISFLNDAWGGTASTDRNLYVDSVDLNGTSVPSASAALFTTSTAHFTIGVPATA